MCLNQVYKKREFLKNWKFEKHPKMPGIKVGYKIMIPVNGGYISSQVTIRQNAKCPVGKWVHEKEVRSPWWEYNKTMECCETNETYRIGFHILLSLGDAMRYAQMYNLFRKNVKIVKVYFKDTCACGVQSNFPVVISKEMWIPRQLPYEVSGEKCKKKPNPK